MKLLVIVLCLLSERFLIHAISLQRFSWFNEYAQSISNKAQASPYFTNPWALLAAYVLPILITVSFFYMLFHSIFFGLSGFILSLGIFYYCLGPQNPFYPVSFENMPETGTESIGRYFIEVNSQLFTVVFWYILAGPLAVLLYRLITLCKAQPAVAIQATNISEVLEWIPARITSIMYLLVGNFQRGFREFIQYVLAGPNLNGKLLNECGLQAVQVSESDDVPMPVAETLVEHATIVFLVFIALFTLVSWL